MFPVHPRTRDRLAFLGLPNRLLQHPSQQLIEPLGYLEFLALTDQARIVFTDSGGIQEETTVLGVPCLTFRDTTERPITVSEGTNDLVGLDPVRMGAAVDAILAGPGTKGRIAELWDGQAGERILGILSGTGQTGRALRERMQAFPWGAVTVSFQISPRPIHVP